MSPQLAQFHLHNTIFPRMIAIYQSGLTESITPLWDGDSLRRSIRDSTAYSSRAYFLKEFQLASEEQVADEASMKHQLRRQFSGSQQLRGNFHPIILCSAGDRLN